MVHRLPRWQPLRAPPATPTRQPMPLWLLGQDQCRRPTSCVLRAITSARPWRVAAAGKPRPPCRPRSQWLAAHQSPDGRWEARRNEAGRETTPDGVSRPNAGADADTGMTGLALLAMLGSGNTHLRGAYRENVRRGLNFLLQSQDAEGCLSGTADRYAAMYCHAIATFALGEDYGMTGERRLEQPLHRAIDYTVAAQDPYGGGWRYKPHDSGDTSQLGWQFMALKSAQTAGIPMPETTRQGIIRYLQSVASHGNGGLASYRPLEAPSRTMTAEAMLCWQFLGIAREHPACDEAVNYLLSAPPAPARRTSTTGTMARSSCINSRATVGSDGTRRSARSWWACKTRKTLRPALGTPIPSGAATAAEFIARPWGRCVSKSTTGSCRYIVISVDTAL